MLLFRKRIILIGSLLFFIYLFYNTPLGHDEWKWADLVSIELLKNGFQNYNGRYLGNLFIMIVVRNTMARVLLLATGLVLMLHLMVRLTETEHSEYSLIFLLSFILLFIMPSTLYRQSLGWIAAYTNFIPPIILFLLWVKWLFDDRKRSPIFVFIIALSHQLFSEHNTILFWLIATGFLAIQLHKSKLVDSFCGISFLGATIGIVVMFSNSSYRRAASDDSGYKQIGQNLSELSGKIERLFLTNGFKNNSILLAIIAILLIVLISKRKENTRRVIIAAILLSFATFFCIWMNLNPNWQLFGHHKITLIFTCLLSAIHSISVLVIMSDTLVGVSKYKTILFWTSSIVIMAPLLLADPIGARCFIATYVFQCLTALILLQELLDSSNYSKSAIISIALSIAIAISICYCSIFSQVGSAMRSREEYIENAINTEKKVITLEKLPNSEYMMFTEPPDDYWLVFFRHYYGIQDDVDVIVKE